MGVSIDESNSYICPICICTEKIEQLVQKAKTNAFLNLKRFPDNSRKLLSTVKHPFVVTVQMGELRRILRDTSSIPKYTSLTILPGDTEIKMGRRFPFRDPKIREFFTTIEQTVRTPVEKWKLSLLQTSGNVEALKSIRTSRISSLREWFLHVYMLFQNPGMYMSISFPNRLQSLPGEFLFLIEESLRLGVSSVSEVNNLTLMMLNITFYSVVRGALQAPREYSEWKWIDNLRVSFCLEGDDKVILFVQKVILDT